MADPDAADLASVPSRPAGDLTTPQLLRKSPGTRLLDLTVTRVEEVAPRMLRITAAGPDVAGCAALPGQDLTVTVGTDGGRVVRRRYTLRRLDPYRATLELDVHLHGTGVGVTWAQSLAPGDTVEAVGPRGRITPDTHARAHLFVGDETALPATLAMAEALDADADLMAVTAVHGDPVWPPDCTLLREARAVRRAPWLLLTPDSSLSGRVGDDLRAFGRRSDVHIYLAGEATDVRRWTEELVAAGAAPERISAKAYWGRTRPNATHGEPLDTETGRTP